MNGVIVSKAMNLQTVGGYISGSFQIENVAEFSINSEPSSLFVFFISLFSILLFVYLFLNKIKKN